MRDDFFFHHLTQTDWELLGLTFDDFVKMCDWAFGKGWTLFPRVSLKDRWNELHGKTHFVIKGTDPVDKTITRIRDAWKLKK